ncbi:hypothetical protein Tco_0318251 [Tanacetum coccineum]
MANLEFCDTYNMVAYLKKTEGSEGFYEIVDFLNASHIRYALIENPTIFVSLIQQFWNTTTARTLDNREIEITATIDGKVKIVTEVSIRRHLKLEDSDGISTLPTTNFFEQLALMGTYIAPVHTQKLFSNMRRASKGYTRVDIPFFPTMLVHGSVVQGICGSLAQTYLADEAASTGVDVRHGGAATTVTSLDAGQGSGNIYKTPSMPRDSSLPRVNTRGSDEGNMTLQELTGRHEHNMESDFKFTAAEEVYNAGKEVSTAEPVSIAGAAVTTASEVVSTASPTRRVSTTNDITMAETLVYIKRSETIDKGKCIMTKSEPVQTKTKLQQRQERLGYEAAMRLQEQLDEEERQRIAMQTKREKYFEAEKARLLAELINQRKKYFAAKRAKERSNKPPTQAQQRTYMSNYIKHMGSHTLQQLRRYSFEELKTLFETTMRRVKTFTPMESDVDRTVPKIAAESSKRNAEEELVQESSKRQKTRESSELADKLRDKEPDELSQEELQQMMIIIIRVGNHTEVYQLFDDLLKVFDRDDLVKLWSLVKERFTLTDPIDDKERELWVELKRLFEPDADNELWKL